MAAEPTSSQGAEDMASLLPRELWGLLSGADKKLAERRVDLSDCWWENGALLSDGRRQPGRSLRSRLHFLHPFKIGASG